MSFTLAFLISNLASANMEWHDFSVSALYGENYEVGNRHRNVSTIEYAGGHTWGDHFFFLDRIDSANKSPTVYTELMVRASGTKIIGDHFTWGPISDVLLASRIEYARTTGENNYVFGVGLDLNFKNFTFFKVHALIRDNEELDNNEMLNMAWSMPFNIFGSNLVYDGFCDLIDGIDGQYATSLNFTSQLKWRLNSSSKNPIYLGVEHSYWDNKFGIRDTKEFRTNERNTSLLLKYHL